MDEREPLADDAAVDEELYGAAEEVGEEDEGEGRRKFDADFVLDKVIPHDIDWRDLVRRHPLLCLGASAGIGLFIGRSKGPAIVAGVSAALTGAVMRQLSDLFDGEVFEF
jgi:hypothetical protein